MDKHANVIVIRKKSGGHGGHHGGAWKVAYADFVTAMMAFFLVMWIIGQSKPVKQAVAGYFRDPGAFETTRAAGVLDQTGLVAESPAGTMDAGGLGAERAALSDAADRIRRDLLKATDVADLRDQIEFTVTSEGLRIELIDQSGSSFFDSGSAALRGESAKVLAVIAKEAGRLQNDIVIEGHTDSRPYGAGASYGNWELSADRANAARRVMERQGLSRGQVQAVRGFADTQLHLPDAPSDPRNRRVSIVVRSKAAAVLDASVRQRPALAPNLPTQGPSEGSPGR